MVLGFAILNRQVLLVRKRRPQWQAGLLNGLGGHVEPGESDVEAMVREFREECGVESQPHNWYRVCTMVGTGWEVVVFASASIDIGAAQTTTDEEVCVRRTDDLGLGLCSHVPWLLGMAHDSDLVDRNVTVTYDTPRKA
jgi:8-oxo-dGTP diphosphatase